MRVTFSIDIDLDTEAITREGQRHGYSIERAREAVLADIECRLSDVCRWRDGVQRVGVRIIETPVLWTTTP